jgi:hypothetical protein
MLRTQILTHGIRTAQLRTVSQVQVMFVAENVTRNGVLVTPRIEVPMGQPVMLTVNGQAPGDNPLDGQDITNRDGQLAIEQAANQRISIPMHLYDRHLEEAQRNAARNAQNGGNPP